MKSIIKEKTNLLLGFLILVLFASCSSQKTLIAVVGGESNYIEIYNGKKELMKDSINSSLVTGLASIFRAKYNFSDTIHVIAKFPDGRTWEKKAKLKRKKYIYIEVVGVEFRITSSNEKRNYY